MHCQISGGGSVPKATWFVKDGLCHAEIKQLIVRVMLRDLQYTVDYGIWSNPLGSENLLAPYALFTVVDKPGDASVICNAYKETARKASSGGAQSVACWAELSSFSNSFALALYAPFQKQREQ